MNHDFLIFPDSEDFSVPVEMVRLDSLVLVLLAVFTAEILLTQVLGLDIWTSWISGHLLLRLGISCWEMVMLDGHMIT